MPCRCLTRAKPTQSHTKAHRAQSFGGNMLLALPLIRIVNSDLSHVSIALFPLAFHQRCRNCSCAPPSAIMARGQGEGVNHLAKHSTFKWALGRASARPGGVSRRHHGQDARATLLGAGLASDAQFAEWFPVLRVLWVLLCTWHQKNRAMPTFCAVRGVSI